MNIHERIQQLRKEHNLSQEQLADRLGVSRQAVSKWESRQSLPDIDKIIAISRYFSVSCDWLLTGKESSSLPVSDKQKVISKQRVMLTASCINIAGFMVTFALWKEWQNMHAIAIGFVFILASFFIMGMGATFMDCPDREIAVYQWLKKIIWLDALVLTAVAGGIISPIIFHNNLAVSLTGLAFLIFVYCFTCFITIYFSDRAIKKHIK